jgi:cupin fold WbuC family metalloprotein
MIEFSTSFLDDLVFRAALSPRSRQHYNVHSGPHEPCQRLFNAIGMDSYIRPHRHLLDPRNELLVAVRGSFAVLKFDDRGVVAGAVRMSAGEGAPGAGRLAAGVELEPEDWHTVIALVPGSVLLEVKAGPFTASAAKEFASWAPEEGDAAASAYLQGLRARLAESGVKREVETSIQPGAGYA